MQCPKCRGLMIDERFCDLYEDMGRKCFEGWRCILCGEILDFTILTNRATFGSSLVQYAGCSPKHEID
ncbi:hypothetical protein [Candidatus Manganitrophus noduliformans]|uniref:Uncharacterized protein n=1 Tax=Candidatus Manganitrophus noduliformans TaxID=2606439 RepID=A0A7X6IA89_9BACT|nr:hypothetical protein [Candidatus Manganitrophus noduliformans]NKE70283.1 hypothetical protein [Candidatus Manganitrophus noduliformans]